MEITTIGLDLAKSVFQLHAVDAHGAVVWPSVRVEQDIAVWVAGVNARRVEGEFVLAT